MIRCHLLLFYFVLGGNYLQLSNVSVVPYANFFPCGYVFKVVGYQRMPFIWIFRGWFDDNSWQGCHMYIWRGFRRNCVVNWGLSFSCVISVRMRSNDGSYLRREECDSDFVQNPSCQQFAGTMAWNWCIIWLKCSSKRGSPSLEPDPLIDFNVLQREMDPACIEDPSGQSKEGQRGLRIQEDGRPWWMKGTIHEDRHEGMKRTIRWDICCEGMDVSNISFICKFGLIACFKSNAKHLDLC